MIIEHSLKIMTKTEGSRLGYIREETEGSRLGYIREEAVCPPNCGLVR